MTEVILFDLDGTITDSAEGITKSVQYALEHFGIDEPDLGKLRGFVGPPLKEQFMKYADFSEKQAETAISLYRERYVKTGIYENKVYDGIESVLRLLKAKGKTLGVASSKPTIYVKQVLEHFNLDQYFTVIGGSELDGTRIEKHEVIEYVLDMLNMQDERAKVLMVGDRSYDVEGALQCGIQCIGVAYGYGGIYELETAGAVYIAQTVEDLKVLAGSSRSETNTTRQRAKAPTSKPSLKDGFWYKALRVLYPLGLYYLITIGITIIISLVFMLFKGVWYGYDIETMVQAEADYSLIILGIASIIAIPCFGRMYQHERGSRTKQVTPSVGIYMATILLLISASQVLSMLMDTLKLSEIFPYYAENVSMTLVANPPIIVAILVVGILVPIAEEIVFRGLVFKNLQDYTGTAVAVLISGLLFGIYHENMIQFIYATILGWLLAFIISRVHSVIVPIIGHIAANTWTIVSERFLSGLIPNDDSSRYLLLGGLVVMVIMSFIYILLNTVKEDSVK